MIERYNQYIKPYLNKSQNINLEAVAVDYYYKDSIHGTTTETEISIPNNVMKNKIDEINSKNSQESFVKNKDPYINFSNSYHENTMSPKNNPNFCKYDANLIISAFPPSLDLVSQFYHLGL